MKNKVAISLIALVLGIQPLTKVEAAADPAVMKKWQEMNQKMMQMQAQMLEMQKDMSALTMQMLSGGSVPAQATTVTTRPVAKKRITTYAPEASPVHPTTIYAPRTDANMPDTVSQGISIRGSNTNPNVGAAN